jgi:hypothetical protein
LSGGDQGIPDPMAARAGSFRWLRRSERRRESVLSSRKRQSGGRNGSIQRKQRSRREKSGNGVNSSADAVLLLVRIKVRGILDQR